MWKYLLHLWTRKLQITFLYQQRELTLPLIWNWRQTLNLREKFKKFKNLRKIWRKFDKGQLEIEGKSTESSHKYNQKFEQEVEQKNFFIIVKSTKIQFECVNIQSKWPPSLSIQSCKRSSHLAIDLRIVFKGIFAVSSTTLDIRVNVPLGWRGDPGWYQEKQRR